MQDSRRSSGVKTEGLYFAAAITSGVIGSKESGRQAAEEGTKLAE